MENYDPNMIRSFIIDIECPSEYGFPCPGSAEWPMNAICIYDNFTALFHVWGLGEYNKSAQVQRLLDEGVDPEKISYNYCMGDENVLFTKLLDWWKENYPAVITGWNTTTFDLPYMANRMQRLGYDMSILSPWGSVFVREKEFMGKPEWRVYISGVADLDYLELYKKNRFITRSSYQLGDICVIELGTKKVDYSEVAKDLRTLHKKDWGTYITYNVVDVNLVKRLDEKRGYLGITYAVAYKAGINFGDVSSPVGTWENIFYRELIDKGVVLPPKQNHEKVGFEGGYVKFPQVGKHRWVCSFDLNSLYPHIIMGWNMSPETIIPQVVPGVNVDLMTEGLDFQRPTANVSIAPSGNMFRNDFQGIAGQMMEKMYTERKSIKKEMLRHEQNVQDAEVEMRKRGLL